MAVQSRVIQGFFAGGRPRLSLNPSQAYIAQPISRQVQAMLRPQSMLRHRGPGFPANVAQAGMAPQAMGGPALYGLVAQARVSGARNLIQMDPNQIGLVSGGGVSLPDAVRRRMESALGADFSAVRWHVGPQAERLGAVAFTIGSDIYFAPGRFQPDSTPGLQLLGHELAHVLQQRQGRVRDPGGTGIVVVQDQALEAEADRLGHRAATHQALVQAKLAQTPSQLRTTISTLRDVPVKNFGFKVNPSVKAGATWIAAGTKELGSQAMSPQLKSSGLGATVQRLTAVTYFPHYNRPATDQIAAIRHQRVAHNGTQTTLAAYLSGYNAVPQNVGGCKHYVPYNWVKDEVERLLVQQGTVGNAVAWLNGLAFPGAQQFQDVNLGLAAGSWGGQVVNVGAIPAINIAPAATIAGVHHYSEAVLNREVDDLIFNLANDPRNLFYRPQSSGDNGGTQIDDPQGAGAMPVNSLRARLQTYRLLLRGLGLNV